jgi:hypothetical protein
VVAAVAADFGVYQHNRMSPQSGLSKRNTAIYMGTMDFFACLQTSLATMIK